MMQEPAPTARRLHRLIRAPRWLGWLAIASGLGVIIAITVAQGRNRTYFALVAVSAAFSFSSLGRATRLKVLLLAVLSAPLLFAGSVPIPLELTLSQSLLIFVGAGEAYSELHPGRAATTASVLGARYYVPFALFALLGLVSTFNNGELLVYWPEVCLVPLVLLFAIDRLTGSETDAMTLVKAVVAAIFAYVGIVWVAYVTGHSYVVASGGGDFAGRFANGIQISLGPLSFEAWSIDVGSLAAMGMPAAVLLALGTRSRSARLLYLAMVLAFVVVLGFTGARGAMIGAVAGTLLALLVSRRLTLGRAIVGLLILVVVLAVAGPLLLELLPSGAVSRVVSLRGGLGSIPNWGVRVGVWSATLAGILKHPLGPGFDYLYKQYNLDQWSVVYTMIINGTGLLGLCALFVMLFQLVRGFLSGLRSYVAGPDADLAAIGLGTVATTLLAGVSASSVLVGPVHPVAFWTIMAAAAVGLARSRAAALAAEPSNAGDRASC